MKLSLAVAVLLGLGIISAKIGMDVLTPERIRDFILSFGWLAPVLYVLIYTIRPLFLFPAIILSLTGGMTFGPWWGTLLDLIGATLGSFLAFGLARKLGRETIQKWMGRRLTLWDQQLEQQGFKAIFLLRLIPLVPFDAVNYGAGLSKVRFRDYALATPFGIIPGAFAYNYLGHSLHAIFSPTFYFAIILVVILAVVPFFFKRRQQQKNSMDYGVEQQK
ncbi:hypothetical protein BEP19_14650 [Ammoniphilus oxalaticus]|uniref:TVP38/TMEM64 family membrane protein n=2 Tax=Ammoniphilus oxalaticus TaxID=66863 RepID=A0A419SF09_9BACL|nr:hypothetical protein BEP19_14650 [Ammoniphilus oxalaticus]